MCRAKMVSILPMRESVKQVAKLLCNYVSTKSFFFLECNVFSFYIFK